MRPSWIPVGGLAMLIVAGVSSAEPPDGAYRSRVNGDWATLSSWEIYHGEAGWHIPLPTDGTPTADHRVTIQAGHTITVTGEQHVGKLHIERGTGTAGPGTRS